MSPRPRTEMSMPGIASFTEELCVGRFRWDLIHPFPVQDPTERQIGDAAVKEAVGFVTAHVDPTALDATKQLPEGLLDDLRTRGYLSLMLGPELGGLGLSRFNAFRVIEAVTSWSTAVGLLLAIQNGIGAGPFAEVLPPGPLRDLVRERVAAGAVSGSADTEPSGQANTHRRTVATPTGDGRAYLLSGEKIHISNAAVADLLAVTATVTEPTGPQTRLFFVDMSSPGVRVESVHEFMGIKGFPSGRVLLRDVRVPRELMLVEDAPGRHTPELSFLLLKGRLHVVVAPALALTKVCLEWSREFALRRHVDGRSVGEYDAVQRLISHSLADLFALETVAQWVMVGDSGPDPVNLRLEQLAAKNITSLACWRVVDRTMSLLAGEGYETAPSKAARGLAPVPMERVFRDARGLRIWGGVDFLVDNWFSRLVTFQYYYPEPDNVAEIEGDPGGQPVPDVPALSTRNRTHLRFVADQARTLARDCLRLARRHPDPEELFARQEVLILTARILTELVTMSLVLSRTAGLADDQGDPAPGTGRDAQDLADVYCCAAARRIAGWRRQLCDDDGPDHGGVAAGWLRGDRFGGSTGDVVAHPPTDVAR